MKILLIILLVLLSTLSQTGCATNGQINQAENDLIKRSIWLRMSSGNDTEEFYDPLYTSYSSNGDVTTLIAAVNKSTSTNLRPSLVKINCSNSLMQSYLLDPQGEWVLRKDWSSREGTTMGALKGLCKKGNYVWLTTHKPQNDPSTLYVLGWDYEIEYKPAAVSGKTYKFYEYNSSTKISNTFYFYSDCNKRVYATSNTLSLEGLSWKSSPDKSSPYGFFLAKACGVDSVKPTFVGTTSPAQAAPSNAQTSTSIDDAKNKCSELGFKEKTEAYGRCVLKLTK